MQGLFYRYVHCRTAYNNGNNLYSTIGGWTMDFPDDMKNDNVGVPGWFSQKSM